MQRRGLPKVDQVQQGKPLDRQTEWMRRLLCLIFILTKSTALYTFKFASALSQRCRIDVGLFSFSNILSPV